MKEREKSLKEKTIAGMFWSSVGRFGTMALSFVSNLILARLLMPSDFGVIGMLHVFIAVSGVFVTAGFGSALIQKKTPTHIDYTSVFWWNLAAAIVFYWILFFSGPLIARFYDMPELCPVLRVLSLSLIIHAFSIVQSNQLRKQLRFRELSMRSLGAAFLGTIVGIIMAFKGFSYWSLVAATLVSSFAGVLLLWKLSSWRPSWEFSVQSLKELFAFGFLMALSSLVETVYTNLQSLIIGKWY
ncbi:MAG: oligosaccharide flippase family protein, partial [Bacteroidales bacterium]|nr:oligosaccharide flippase family protein [Bacteroidales bacterium]